MWRGTNEKRRMRHDKFLYANKVLPNHCQMMVAEQRGLTDWAYRTSTHEASPPVLPQRGTEGFAHNPHLRKI
jgi:hypothetical protein